MEDDENQFYIQDQRDVVDTIAALVAKESETSPTLSIDDLQQLPSNTVFIAIFDEAPYRAVIQSEANENEVKVYYIDYGNTEVYAKTSLKRCSEQLSSYPRQAKRCQLYGIPTAKVKEAFEYLQTKSDEGEIEFSLVNEKDQCLNILIYIEKKCLNEQFGCDLTTIEQVDTTEKKKNDDNEEVLEKIPDDQSTGLVEQKDEIIDAPEEVTTVAETATAQQTETEKEGNVTLNVERERE